MTTLKHPPKIDFRLVQGTDWEIPISFLTPEGLPDLTFNPVGGKTYKMQVRTRAWNVQLEEDPVFDFDGVIGANYPSGQLTELTRYQYIAYMRRDDTLLIQPGTYYYDLRIRYERDVPPELEAFRYSDKIYAYGQMVVESFVTEVIS